MNTASRFSKGQSLKPVDHELIEQLPGPGAYDNKGVADLALSKTRGKNGIFGTTEVRFVKNETLKTPGPGAYINEQTQQTGTTISEQDDKRRSHSVYANSEIRNVNFRRSQSNVSKRNKIDSETIATEPETV